MPGGLFAVGPVVLSSSGGCWFLSTGGLGDGGGGGMGEGGGGPVAGASFIAASLDASTGRGLGGAQLGLPWGQLEQGRRREW